MTFLKCACVCACVCVCRLVGERESEDSKKKMVVINMV